MIKQVQLRLKSSYNSSSIEKPTQNLKISPKVKSWIDRQREKLQITVPKNQEIQTTAGENILDDKSPSEVISEQNKKLSILT